MWVAKLSILHDCIIANKCREFKVSTISQPFNVYVEDGKTYSPEVLIQQTAIFQALVEMAIES